MPVFFFINDKFECCDDFLINKSSRAIIQMILFVKKSIAKKQLWLSQGWVFKNSFFLCQGVQNFTGLLSQGHKPKWQVHSLYYLVIWIQVSSFKKVKNSLEYFEMKNKIQQHHQQVFAIAVFGKGRFHFERILTRLPLLFQTLSLFC